MTAPDLPTWTVADDADGDETLWYGDTAVLRRFEVPSVRLAAGVSYDLLWDVLTRVLAPDEATVERLARAAWESRPHLQQWPNVNRVNRVHYRDQVYAVLAALAGTSAQARHTADEAAGGGA